MTACRLCKKDKKLIKAHIIPESFFRHLKGESEHLSLVPSARKPTIVGRTLVGEYDPSILCQECDAIFGKLDEYGKQVLLDDEGRATAVEIKREHVGWEMKIEQPLKLYKFIISMLWRASISQRPYFKLIKLGPHEDKIEIALRRDHFDEAYEVYVAKFTASAIPGAEKSILNPYTTRILGLQFCRFHINGYLISIKVDKQPLPQKMQTFKLKDNKLKILKADFDGSGQLKLMIDTYPSN